MRALGALLLPLGGCVGVWSDSHAVFLWLPELSGAGQGPQYGSMPVLRGTELCPRLCADDRDLPASCTDAFAACHQFGVSGCHVADQVGTVFLSVADTCGGPDDVVTFDVYAPGQLRAALVDWEALGDDLFGVGSRYEWDPQQLRLAGRFGVTSTLVSVYDDRLVAFELGRSALSSDVGSVERAGLDFLTVPPGALAALTLTVDGTGFADFAYALGVDPTEAATLEVGAGSAADGRLGARAMFRDAEGHLMYGVPATWTLESGDVALDGADLPGPDFVQVLDICRPPDAGGGQREAVLRATYRDLTDTVRLVWATAPAAPDPAWQRPDRCPPEPTDTTASTGSAPTDTGAAPTGRATGEASRARAGRCGCGPGGLGGLGAWAAAALVVRRRRR